MISIPISGYLLTRDETFDRRGQAAVFNTLVAEIQDEIDSVDHIPGVVRLEFSKDVSNEEIEKIIGRVRNVPELFKDTPFERVEYVRVNVDTMAKDMAYYSMYTPTVSVGLNHIIELSDWRADGSSRALPKDWNNRNHWYFDRVKLPEAWKMQGCLENSNRCGGSKDVVVAVIDSGLAFGSYTANYRWCHPQTGACNNYNTAFGVAPEVAGINLWKNPDGKNANNGFCNDYHGIDMTVAVYNQSAFNGRNPCNSSQYYKEGEPHDDYFHGTYVTGIVSSSMNNASPSPVGIAHNVSILPIKATMPFTQSLEERVLEASIYYGAKYADVINLSLSTGRPVAQAAIDYAVGQGVVVVAAAGNNGRLPNHHVGYPAADPKVIAVGATGTNNRRIPYSAYNNNLDFVAPVGTGSGAGDAVWQQYVSCSGTSSCRGYFNYFNWGTSLAAPQISGAAALIKSLDSSLSPNQIKQVLIDTAQDIPPAGKNPETGYGMINLQKIYEHFESIQPPASCGELDGMVFPPNQETWPSEDFCSSGKPEPSNPQFPSPGGKTEWECVGSNNQKVSCQATRESAPEPTKPVCGDLHTREFSRSEKDWPSEDFCFLGSPEPTSPVFPKEGETTNWDCKLEGSSVSCWARNIMIAGECSTDEDCRRNAPYEICFQETCLRGDINNDSSINMDDFHEFIKDFISFKERGWETELRRSDLNDDGRISMGDYSIFVMSYRISNRID